MAGGPSPGVRDRRAPANARTPSSTPRIAMPRAASRSVRRPAESGRSAFCPRTAVGTASIRDRSRPRSPAARVAKSDSREHVRTRDVEDAGRRRPGERSDRVPQVRRVGGRRDLIGWDPHPLARAELEGELHEEVLVPRAPAVDDRGPQGEVRRICAEHRPLALELRPAVDAHGRRRRALAVGAVEPVEDVLGREEHRPPARGARPLGDHRGRLRVHCRGEHGLVLASLDVRERRGEHHEVGRNLGHASAHRVGLPEVEGKEAGRRARRVRPDDLPARGDERGRRLAPDLPRGTDDERPPPHQPCFSAQSYGIWGEKGSRRSISSGRCGTVAQFATSAGPAPIPLNPFHTSGGTWTSL